MLALIALPLIRVDVVVRGTGIVRPSCEKIQLQSPVAGRLRTVRVSEGSYLHVGDTLLTLDESAIRTEIATEMLRQRTLQQQIHDLQALSRGLPPAHFQDASRRSEFDSYLQQRKALELNRSNALEKWKRNEALFRSGVISADEFENHQHALNGSEEAVRDLELAQRKSWQNALNELLQAEKEVGSNLEKLHQAHSEYTLTAPVEGSLEAFSGWYPGAYVPQGQALGFISPNAFLQVESYVTAKDIGFLYEGMPTRILVDAFDYNQWGSLNGVITAISSDFTEINATPCYKVRCRIHTPFVALRNGQKAYLKKGMTVQTRFRANRRSLLQLLYERTDQWLNPASNTQPS
jgi:HlyD family secretion protein